MGLIDRFLGLLDGALGLPDAAHPAAPPVFQATAPPREERSISLGELVPPAQVGRPQTTPQDDVRALTDGLSDSTWVYACVNLIARSAASVSWAVYAPDGSPVEGHALSAFLAAPNPQWSASAFYERAFQHLLLTGNATITKVRGLRDVPAELWPVKPSLVRPIPSREELIGGYEVKDGASRFNVPAEDMIHLMLPNPDNPLWGLSPLAAGHSAIETDREALAWNRVALANRAVADGMLTFNRPLSRQAWLEARYRLRQQHMGARNARTPYVFGSDARWTAFDRSPVEMDFIEGRKLNREDICAIYGVPPVLVGILDHATYSNFDVAQEVFWRQTLIPLLVAWAGALTLAFRDDFGLRPGEEVWFDEAAIPILSRVTPEVSEIVTRFFGLGVPFALLNERFGLEIPRFPGDDVSYLGSGYAPASSLAVDPFAGLPAPPAPADAGGEEDDDEEPGEGEEEALRARLLRLQRRLSGRR